MYDLVLEDAILVSSQGRRRATVAVEGGQIVAIGDAPDGPSRETIHAEGRLLTPGFVDTHVHFRSPGHPHKEDWESGSRAAASGGVTTVCDMPNTSPPTLSRETWEEKRRLAEASSHVDFGLWVGAASDNHDAIRDLMESGDACGIKVFMGASTGPLLVDEATLERLFQETRGLMGVHAEDEKLLVGKRDHFLRDPNPDHNAVRDPSAAAAAVATLVALCEAWPRPVHICHLSTRAELDLVEAVRGRLPITTEVSPHHLFLSAELALGNLLKCNPPIRSAADRDALWERLHLIDTLGSDHAPHTREEKARPYWDAPSGIPGVETTFPLMAGAAREGRLTLERLVALSAETPARLFGFSRKGRIALGADADLLLFREDPLVPLSPEMLLTRVGWSPFLGQKVAAKPEKVFVRGRLVAEDGRIVPPGASGRAGDERGRLVTPSRA